MEHARAAASSPAHGGLRPWVQLARPFTLLAPALGMVSGGVVAWFADGEKLVDAGGLWITLVLGAAAAGLLNAASNAVNQVYDFEADCINKPSRPLPRGRITRRGAWVYTVAVGLLALAMAGAVGFWTGRLDTLLLFLAAALFSLAYSVPPLRTKARGWLANLTVAIPRGVLLKVAGWSLVQSALEIEAWYIGLIMGLFLLGATTTKDFSDMKGDAAQGVRSLPVVYGPRRAAMMVAPFLFLPFLLIPLGAETGALSGGRFDLWLLGGVSTLWGLRIAVLILADPNSLTRTENHPAWRHMYYMMVFLQLGFMAAYWPV